METASSASSRLIVRASAFLPASVSTEHTSEHAAKNIVHIFRIALEMELLIAAVWITRKTVKTTCAAGKSVEAAAKATKAAISSGCCLRIKPGFKRCRAKLVVEFLFLRIT